MEVAAHSIARVETPAQTQSKWFSPNPDKAWGEKFFLIYIPLCFAYQGTIIKLHLLDVGNFWHITQHLIMWVPYCIILPAYLRRNSGVPYLQSYAFKLQLYLFVYGFLATYFHTEYFFEILGLRYHLPQVTLFYDSYLVGPNETVARQQFEKVPLGFYITAFAFFTIYHTGGVVIMRRVRNMISGFSEPVQKVGWVAIVAATAWFFGFAEPYFYNAAPEVKDLAYYININAMLKYGAIFYAMYFIVSFPNIFWLDEEVGVPKWSIRRTIVEASFVSMISLFLIDSWAWVFGRLQY